MEEFRHEESPIVYMGERLYFQGSFLQLMCIWAISKQSNRMNILEIVPFWVLRV